jgi:hypothetical protein
LGSSSKFNAPCSYITSVGVGKKKRLHEELMQVEREEAELEELSDEEKEGEEVKEKRIRLINKRLLLDQAQDELWQESHVLPQHDSFPGDINAVVPVCTCNVLQRCSPP